MAGPISFTRTSEGSTNHSSFGNGTVVTMFSLIELKASCPRRGRSYLYPGAGSSVGAHCQTSGPTSTACTFHRAHPKLMRADGCAILCVGHVTLKRCPILHKNMRTQTARARRTHTIERDAVQRRSGGVPSATRSVTNASKPCVCVRVSPKRRTDTVRSSTSRAPTARMTGTLPSECSRTL